MTSAAWTVSGCVGFWWRFRHRPNSKGKQTRGPFPGSLKEPRDLPAALRGARPHSSALRRLHGGDLPPNRFGKCQLQVTLCPCLPQDFSGPLCAQVTQGRSCTHITWPRNPAGNPELLMQSRPVSVRPTGRHPPCDALMILFIVTSSRLPPAVATQFILPVPSPSRGGARPSGSTLGAPRMNQSRRAAAGRARDPGTGVPWPTRLALAVGLGTVRTGRQKHNPGASWERPGLAGEGVRASSDSLSATSPGSSLFTECPRVPCLLT